MDQRAFYHSFPRPRGESPDETLKKGLQILKLIMDIGFVLAPEAVVWRLPQADGTDREIDVGLCRLCFTELAESELNEHTAHFGGFSLEFPIERLRQAGAIPVIYMPQAISGDRGLSSVGSLVVTMMDHTYYTLDQLESLRRNTDEDWIKENYPGATGFQDDALLTLNNTNASGDCVANYQVPVKSARDLLAFVGFQNAPLWLLRNTLEFVQNLFYPTDNTHSSELLAYYRQREWRLAPGLSYEGATQGRELTLDEKRQVAKVSPDFWLREIKYRGALIKRIDAARIIDQIGGRPAHEQIRSVIVPDAALEAASTIVGGKVPVRLLHRD